MAIPEPSSALGLWPAVKAYSGWPETDETRMQLLADHWTDAGATFEQAAAFDPGAGTAAWGDAAGQEFAAATGRTTGRAAQSAADAAILSRAAGDFAQVVSSTKYALTDLINLNLPLYAAVRALPAGVREPFEAMFVAQVAQYAQSVMTEATARASAAGAVRVSTMPPGAPVGNGPPADSLANVPSPPPPGSSPADVARWWNSIPPNLRQQYLNAHPELVGNLDGIPAKDRNDANRIVLHRRLAELTAERGRLQAELAATPQGPRHQLDQIRLRRDLGELDEKLRGLNELNGALSQPDTFLLGLDTSGRGRFILSRGNPDLADNVATFVPGTGASLLKSGGQVRAADTLAAAARAAGGGNTAVVTWMDYDTPPSIVDAVRPGRAEEGAARLERFQQGLRATHQGAPSHNTVIGHSYGSTVAGLATSGSRRAPVDDVIAAGSPGLGTDHASDHHVGAGHVWVIESPHDWVADTGTAGRDPSSVDFGARVFSSEPGPPVGNVPPLFNPPPGYRWDGHSSYFDDAGQAGRDRMGDIITGREPHPR